mgnify:CR=1 FL=1
MTLFWSEKWAERSAKVWYNFLKCRVIKNVGKDQTLELSERQQNIVSVIKLHSTITIPELAQRMSGKKTVTTRTIERDIAALQAKGILKREGGRKSGKWIVVDI